MNNQPSFSDVLLLARVYLSNPTKQNEHFLYQCLNHLLRSPPSRQTRHRVLRLRLFLFRCESNYIPRRKFKAFAAREFLIRFSRPSQLLSGFDSRSCRSGLNSAAASSAQLTLVGS